MRLRYHIIIAAILSLAGQAAFAQRGDTLEVSHLFTTYIRFPIELITAQRSDMENTIGEIVPESKDLVRLQARQPFDRLSNLTVIDSKGFLYTFYIKYSENPTRTYYDVSKMRTQSPQRQQPQARRATAPSVSSAAPASGAKGDGGKDRSGGRKGRDRKASSVASAAPVEGGEGKASASSAQDAKQYASASSRREAARSERAESADELSARARARVRSRRSGGTVEEQPSGGTARAVKEEPKEEPAAKEQQPPVRPSRSEASVQEVSRAAEYVEDIAYETSEPEPIGYGPSGAQSYATTGGDPYEGARVGRLRSADAPVLSDILKLKQSLYHLASRRQRVTITVENLFSYSDILYMVIRLDNNSGVSYDSDGATFMLSTMGRNKTKPLNSEPVLPNAQLGSLTVPAGQSGRIAYSFDKISLAEDQQLEVSVSERTKARTQLIVLMPKDVNLAKKPF